MSLSGPERQESAAGELERQVRLYPNRLAVLSTNWRLTFAELNGMANHLGRCLERIAGQVGDRIALLMRHDAPLIVSAVAGMKIGRVFMVLNPSDPVSRLGHLLADAEPTAIVTELGYRPTAERIARAGQAVLCFEDVYASGEPHTWARSGPNPETEISGKDVAFLIYTSGSTGRPRGVLRTHAQVLQNVRRVAGGLLPREGDRMALLAALSGGHGMSTFTGSLLLGMTLCPFPTMEQGVLGLASWIRQHQISLLPFSASLFRHFLRTLASEEQFPSVRVVRLGSGSATWEDVAAFRRHFPSDCVLLHTLSASETGNISQFRVTSEMPLGVGRLPVGRVVPGVQVVLLDEQGQESDVGEMVIRSAELSSGYWRDPTLTAQRFSGESDTRSFHSGDMARRRADGILEFLGRKDDRVKIRGYRIEPGEIADALRRVPGVENAVVLPRRRGEEVDLVAYVIACDAVRSAAAMRLGLRDILPPHLIPAGYVFLDEFPHSAHGKIDRQQLLTLAPQEPDVETEPPQTETEVLLAEIWGAVLGVAAVGRQTAFFDVGGDSLKAAVVAAKVHAALGVELRLSAFLDHPTLQALATELAILQSQTSTRPPLVRVSRDQPLPLSFAQERIWLHSQTPAGCAGYTVSVGFRIIGALDVDVFRWCVSYLAHRHEILRTTFSVVKGQPVQIIHSPEVYVPCLDLMGVANAQELANAYLRQEARRPFDLTQFPLVRFSLLRIHPTEHMLFRIHHHILSDNWSWEVYFAELARLYEERLAGQEPSLPHSEALQYADYACWQRRFLSPEGQEYRKGITWWTGYLAGNPAPLEIPCRRAVPVYGLPVREGIIESDMDPGIAAQLDALGRQYSATSYAIQLAAFVALVAAQTGHWDVALGGYVTNRDRVEVQRMFGMFANMTTLRFRYNPDQPFREWIHEVCSIVGQVQAHSQIPYETVVTELNRLGLAVPEIRTIVSVQNASLLVPVEFAGLVVKRETRARERMPWGFTLTLDVQRERYIATFDAALYDPAGVRALLGRYRTFVARAAAHPERKVGWLAGFLDAPAVRAA